MTPTAIVEHTTFPLKATTLELYVHLVRRPAAGDDRLPSMTSKEVLRRLASDGWYVIRRKGSHLQLRHPIKPERVTVGHPRQDYPIGTLKSIEKQSGVVLRDRRGE